MECDLYKRDPSAKSLAKIGLYELLGTCILVFGVNNMGTNAYGPALALFIAINITGAISGGHHNPAVTLGVWINEDNKKENLRVLFTAIISQFIGGMLAVALCKLIEAPDNMTYLAPEANRHGW